MPLGATELIHFERVDPATRQMLTTKPVLAEVHPTSPDAQSGNYGLNVVWAITYDLPQVYYDAQGNRTAQRVDERDVLVWSGFRRGRATCRKPMPQPAAMPPYATVYVDEAMS